MDVQSGYDQWSATYDSEQNYTRDLDAQVTRDVLGAQHCRALLEIGSGTGKNTAWLAQIADNLYAFDFSIGMMAKARAKIQSPQVHFCRTDLTDPWPVSAASMDWIVCNLVLEHIQELAFIFAQARRSLVRGGRFFICELHPFKQYQGRQAIIQQDGEVTPITAYQHHISDFLDAAAGNGFALLELKEWWHADDQGQPPRLVSFTFEKNAAG